MIKRCQRHKHFPLKHFLCSKRKSMNISLLRETIKESGMWKMLPSKWVAANANHFRRQNTFFIWSQNKIFQNHEQKNPKTKQTDLIDSKLDKMQTQNKNKPLAALQLLFLISVSLEYICINVEKKMIIKQTENKQTHESGRQSNRKKTF